MTDGCRRPAQLRNQGRDEPLCAQDIDVEHPLPVRGIAVLDAFRAARATRDLDQRIDRSALLQPLGERVDVDLLGEVGGEGHDADLGLERREPVGSPRDGDDIPSRRSESSGARFADARTRTCHHRTTCHASTVVRTSLAAHHGLGARVDLLGLETPVLGCGHDCSCG